MLCSIAASQKMQSFGKRGQLAAVDFEEGGAQSAQVEMDLLLTPHARAALSLGAARREEKEKSLELRGK